MGKLVVGLGRFLPLCALLLVLPSLVAAQCQSQLAVQSVLTQDAGGNNKIAFTPGESIQIVGQINNAYGAYMLAANGAQIAVKSSFYNDTKRVDIPPGVSTWPWNVTAPSQQSSYTVTVSVYDHFCGVWVSGSANFTVGSGTGMTITLERALTHNGVGDIGQEQTAFAPGDIIRYAAIVNNPGSSTVTPRFDFHATGSREIFSWTGDVPIAPGIWYFHLHTSVPTDAPAGAYTLQVTMTYNGQTTTKQSPFTIGHTGTLPDLSSTAILYNPANLIPGGTVFFDSGVQNSGSQGTGVFNVRWFVDDVSVGYGSHAGVPANSTVLDGNSQFSWVATAGTHTIMFAVDVDNHVLESDESNNSRSVTVTVASQTAQPPVITLLGDNPLYHTQGCPFVGAGATALDAKDGDLTNSILITGTEQINNPGMHTITYTVTNSYGLPDTKTRQVVVFGAIGTPLCFVGKPAGKAPNLVVLVHGCCTDFNAVIKDWDSFGREIAGAIKAPGTWEIVVWDWSKDTSDLVPGPAYNAAQHQGNDLLGPAIAKYPYKYVHLIGHSAGARLIWLAAIRLAIDKVSNNKREEWPFIHLTFLDSYQPNDDDYGNLYEYPNYYSEHYVNRGSLIPFKADLPLTDPCLKNAFNFDITDWKNNDKNPNDPVSGHFWPVRWYKQSVTTPRFAYGYPLSFEGSNGSYDALSGWYLHHRQCYLTDVGTKCETGDKAPACW